MKELIFQSNTFTPDKFSKGGQRCVPYRTYEPLSFTWALSSVAHLTPRKANIERLPEGLPDQVIRAVESFVNDAKILGRWFCVKSGEIEDDQDEDILTTAAYVDDEERYYVAEYTLYRSQGYYGPTPDLIRLLCDG